MYTGIINDNWYIPINNIYNNGNAVKSSIHDNNIILSDYCINMFNKIKKDKSFFTPKLTYENNKLKIDVQYTEDNQKDMEYLLYTIYLGKEYADQKYNLSYSDERNNNNFIVKEIDKYSIIKCIYGDNVVLLKNIIKQGNIENLLNEISRNTRIMMKKRAKKLTESLNNFRLGNNIGYEYLHLICGYTLCYLLVDKIELLKLKNMYEFNNFDKDYETIKKYKELFNKKLQSKLNVRLIGGNKNKFAYYKKNMDNNYIEFINDYYKIIKNNSITIKNILNKFIK
jgi:hypothetical protein